MTEITNMVFIVDDDSSVRIGLSRLLDSAGYATEVFGSAMEYLERPHYDGIACLILDVRMPGISGPKLYQRLVEEGIDLPTIFITAHGELSTGVEASERGVVKILQKPVDESVLLDAVSRALACHKSASDE
jgi:FixJ family two-component response regulator